LIQAVDLDNVKVSPYESASQIIRANRGERPDMQKKQAQ